MVGIRCQHNICSSSKNKIGYFWAAPTSSGWLQMAAPNSGHDISNNHADSSTMKAYHNGTCVVLYNIHVALHPLSKQCSREVGSPLISLLSTGSLSQGDNTIWFTVRAPVHRRIFFHINIGNHNIADIDLILLQVFITPRNTTSLYSQNLCISQKLLCAPRTRFNALLCFPRMKPQDSSSRCLGAVTVAVDRSASAFACGTSEEVKTKFEGILQIGPYPPCLRMADRALLAGYPRIT